MLYKLEKCKTFDIPIVSEAIVIDNDLLVKLFFHGSPILLPLWFVKGKDCRLTKKSYLENFPPYIKSFSDNRATNIMDELQQIRYKKGNDIPKFASKLATAQMLRYSLLPAYLCEYAGPMRIYYSQKSDQHERVAAENVVKFNDLPQALLCDNHLENKFIKNRRDGVVVRASASQSVDLGFIPLVESYQKTLKKWHPQLPCLALGIYGRLWRTSRQVRLLCPWARHLTGRLRLYVEDRWPRHLKKGNSQASADFPSKV